MALNITKSGIKKATEDRNYVIKAMGFEPEPLRIAVIVFANQNPVSKREAERIRRAVKKEYPDYSLRVIANETPEMAEAKAAKYDYVIAFDTHDINYDVWASFNPFLSTLDFEGKNGSKNIELN